EVRVPVHLHDLATKVYRAKKQLHDKLGRDPSQAELADALKVPAKSIETLESSWLKYPESLPAFDSVEDGEPLQIASDTTPVDEILVRLQEDGQIATALTSSLHCSHRSCGGATASRVPIASPWPRSAISCSAA